MRPQSINPSKLAELFRREFELCQVKPGETVALLSDLTARREYVTAAFAALETLGANGYELCVNSTPTWTKVGIETVGACKGTVEAFAAADLLVCLHVPFFTRWLKQVRDAGTRVLIVVDHPDDLEQGMAPKGLKEAVIHAGKRLERAKTLRVVNDAGTDLTVDIGEYETMVQYGYADEPGRVDHWGAGHALTFPNEGTANGTVVFAPGDIIVLPYNRYITEEVRVEVADGFVRDIKGGLDARLMTHWLEDNRAHPGDMDGHAVSHLGWGLNPQARWDNLALYGDDPERNVGAARAFAGNFMFSTGPNTQGGGTRNTKGHLDIPMRDCSVMLDGDMILDHGRFVDEKMIVAREPR
ncbi:hypothetical protein [Nocardia sp. R6R-6]|uniref:hypothetical protein n=1 Tax=Nocardia sp. R6R-6 TaxID=3459303 RepID=UPI00403D71F4